MVVDKIKVSAERERIATELYKSVKEIEKFMRENCTAHDMVIVTQTGAELLIGDIGIKFDPLED